MSTGGRVCAYVPIDIHMFGMILIMLCEMFCVGDRWNIDMILSPHRPDVRIIAISYTNIAVPNIASSDPANVVFCHAELWPSTGPFLVTCVAEKYRPMLFNRSSMPNIPWRADSWWRAYVWSACPIKP